MADQGLSLPQRSWVRVVAVSAVIVSLIGLLANLSAVALFLEEHEIFGMEPPVPSTDEKAESDIAWQTGGPSDRACGTVSMNHTVNSQWGPDRPTYTMDDPAPWVTLNSITDNPFEGDERAFLEVKSATNKDIGGYCGGFRVVDGDILLFRVYVANSAGVMPVDPTRNVASEVGLQFKQDSQVSSLRHVTAYLSSTSANPREVWSTIELISEQPVRIDPIAGSCTVYSNAIPIGLRLDDDPWESKAMLGVARLDGELRPVTDDSLIVTCEVRITRVGS